MITYNDFLKIDANNPKDVMYFVHQVIDQHKSSDLYRTALDAYEYIKHKNATIAQYQKLLYTMTGEAVPDNYSANFKLASRFFNRFVVQENQHLLANGVTWQNDDTEEKLGSDFDYKLQEAGKAALWGGVSFGFFNMDHLDVFSVLEYAPLYDEENGAMMAGVRFWQLDADKPLRATFYEIDGYTEFIWNVKEKTLNDSMWTEIEDGKGMIPKRPYKLKVQVSEADGEEIYDGENYPTFPIIPLWGNPEHQSELVGLREQIDCYDLIKSGFANTVDEGSIIYWLIQNAGGMDDIDLAKFVKQIKTMHATTVGDEDGVSSPNAEAKTIEPPYQSRESLLALLRADLYEDAMALDTKNIADGAVTATQIKAAYEPLTEKVDQFEHCVLDFLSDILEVAGITDENPTFTRSYIINQQEEVQSVLQAAEYTGEEYTTRKLLNIFGDGDLAESILEGNMLDEAERMGYGTEEEDLSVAEDIASQLEALLAEIDEGEGSEGGE